LGTAFNVNLYSHPDSSVSATLTEGKVQIRTGNGGGDYLLPGEQLAVNEISARVLKADTEAVTAWKNGLFLFNGTSLPEVMEQLARWYDVKIEYDQAFTERKFFTGEIKRNVPVSKLLEMMELTGIARFRITNNTIMISTYSP
jgi:transmembrane sensor